MTRTLTVYRSALEGLADTVREAHALAAVLEHVAALLRGRPPDPEGPGLYLYPSIWQVRRAQQSRDIAVEAARAAWAALPAEAQEGAPSPEEAAEAAGGAWA